MTTIKTVMMLVCVGLMMFVMPAAAQNIVAIENVTLPSGDTQDVPIRLLNSTGVGGAQVTFTFDQSIVNVTNAVEGDFTGIFNLDYSDVSNGILRITCMVFGADLTGDLTIATITLDAVGTSGSCELGLYAELSTSGGDAPSSSVDNGTFAIDVPPAPTLASIAITPTSRTLSIGGTQPFIAVCTDTDGNVMTCPTLTWDSTDTDVGEITAAGEFTASAAGTTTITASAEGKTSNEATVTVSAAAPTIASIAITPTSRTLSIGGTQPFIAVCTDTDGNVMTCPTLAWDSTDTDVGEITAAGEFTASAAGTTTITASAEGKTSNAATVTVSAAAPVPATTPIGIAALVGLLGLIGAGIIMRRR